MKFGVAVALVAGCISPVMHFGAGKTNDEGQHDRARQLTPPLLAPVKIRGGAIVSEPIRVWADDDYRAQNVDWKHTFDEQLAYANTVLGPELGINLVPRYAAWSYHAPSAPLDQTLAALGAQDDGDGAFAVIGLTSALAMVDANIEHLGVANLPGKLIVLRGYANLVERAAFARGFPELDPEERENLHEARRHYAGAALLLHELGHSLGAQHEDDPTTLMNPMISGKAAGYSEQADEVMAATLDARRGRVEPLRHVAAAPRQIEISVGILGLDYGGLPLDDTGYAALLARVAPGTELVLRFRKGGPRRRLAALMDTARAAGVTKISLVSD